MSESNRGALSYILESTFGTTPSGSLKRMRIKSEGLKQDTTFIASQELDPTAQVADQVRVGIGASGPIELELSALGSAADGFPDDLFRAALRASSWSAAVTVTGTTIAAVNATSGVSRFTDSGSGFGSLVVGQWVRVSGFATAANNGFFKITAAAAGQIDLSLIHI